MKISFAALLTLLAAFFFSIQTARAQSVEFYFFDSEINGLSDVTLPDRRVSLTVELSIPDTTIDNGTVTVTLPDEFTFVGTWTWGRGDVTSVDFTESTAVIHLQKGTGSSESTFNIKMSVKTASWADLPNSATLTEINASVNVVGTNGTSFVFEENWQTALVYSKGTISTSAGGSSLKAGDEFTIYVSVEPFTHFEMYYSRISVNAPYLTDIVSGSVSGLADGTFSSGQIYAEFPNGGIRSFNFSFRVKVRDQFQLDNSGETEISLYEPDPNFRIRTPFTGNPNDPSHTFHRRIFGTKFNTIQSLPIEFPPNEIVVNSTGDQPLDATKEGCTTGGTISNGDPECTLRSAIQAVNLGRGERIEFNIPGETIPTIPLLSALPAVTVPIEIDGTTQSAGLVEVRGNGGEFNGLDLQGGDSLVQGLVLNGFTGIKNAAIKISTGGGNRIRGNYIGTDKTATSVVPTTNGIIIDGSSQNEIGGTEIENQNIIAGGAGIEIISLGADDNKVINNFIGLSPQGAFLDSGIGILLTDGKRNVLGTAGAGNTIAATESGIAVLGLSPIESLYIGDNKIGLDSTGAAHPNTAFGISVGAFDSYVLDGFTVHNNKVAGSSANILIHGDNVKNGTISENLIGMQFGDTQERPVNLAEDRQLYGLHISGASDITVSKNIIAGHRWNVIVAGARQTSIGDGGIGFGDPYNEYGLDAGITAGRKIWVLDNKIGINSSNQIPANSEYYCGIAVFAGADEVVIENNTIAKHETGAPKSSIYLVNGKNHRVSGNIIGTTGGSITNTAIGIYILDAKNVKVGAYDGGAGNVIGRNQIGVFVSGDASSLQFKQNTIGTDANGSASIGNSIGMFIDKTGIPPEGEPAVLLEENTIAGNSTFGLRIASENQVKLLKNYIGITSQFQALSNKVGIDTGASPVVAQENTIAYNTENGIHASGEGSLFLTKNKIYENGDDSAQDGIVYMNTVVAPPHAVAAIRSEPDPDGNVTILLAVSSPNSEEPVIYEFYSDLDREHPQGRVYLFERTVSGSDSYVEVLSLPASHPLATAKTVTVTKTQGGETSTFSTKSIVDTYELPQLDILPSEPAVLKLAWLKSDVFKLQEGITPGGPWYDDESDTVVENGFNTVSIEVDEGERFFRLILDPKSLVTP